MAVSQYPWTEFKKTKAGIKIHTRIVFEHENNMVKLYKIMITPAKSADRNKMDVLKSLLLEMLYISLVLFR